MENFKKIKEEAEHLFHKNFYEVLNSSLTKYYGLNETGKILKLMEKGILSISNTQTFFCNGNNFSDISHNIRTIKSTSLHNYLLKILLECKENLEANTELTLSYFLFYIAERYKEDIGKEGAYETLEEFFKIFLYTFLEHSEKNKVTIRMYGSLGSSGIKFSKNISHTYKSILRIFLGVYKKIQYEILAGYSIPNLEFIYYLTEGTRDNQIAYLSEVYKISEPIVRNTVASIADLGEDTPELRVALSILKQKSRREDVKEFFEESVIAELRDIKENCNLKTALKFELKAFHKFWKELTGILDYPEKYGVKSKFIPRSEASKLLKEVFSEVVVNCSSTENFSDIKTLVYLAAELALVRYREVQHFKETVTLGITLEDIPSSHTSIIEGIRELEKGLRSKYNVNFQVVPFIKEESATRKCGHSEPKYFRIISDIHADINKHMGYSFNFGDDYVLCCGDIAGNHRTARGWLNTNIRLGAYVTGNHLGYESSYPEKNSEEGLLEKYGMQFHPHNTRNVQATFTNLSPRKGIYYLNNTSTEVNGIKIFGAPLYTNFELFGKEKADACAMLCQNQINDFKYVKIYRDREIRFSKDNESWEITKCIKPYITNLTPDICKFYYIRTLNKFKDFCKSSDYHGEPLVFMSHFGVSIYSIADKYKSDPVSAYFASDMTSDIKEALDKGVNLRVVAHGHVHNKCNYILKYGSKEVLVIAEPFGYYTEREDNQQDQTKYGFRLSFKDIKGNKPWSKVYPEIPVYEI